MTHSLCTALVEDLKAYDFTLGGTLARGAGAGSSKDGNPSAVTGTPLATMLDRALEEIFVPWLEGARYLESESKALVEAYSSLLNRFTKYHVRISNRLELTAGNGIERQASLDSGSRRESAFVEYLYIQHINCVRCSRCAVQVHWCIDIP